MKSFYIFLTFLLSYCSISVNVFAYKKAQASLENVLVNGIDSLFGGREKVGEEEKSNKSGNDFFSFLFKGAKKPNKSKVKSHKKQKSSSNKGMTGGFADLLKMFGGGASNEVNVEKCVPKTKEAREIVDTYIKAHNSTLTNDERNIINFSASDCTPVMLIPGIFGSKLTYKVTSCKDLQSSNPKLFEACGLTKNCTDGLEEWVWLRDKYMSHKSSCMAHILFMAQPKKKLQKKDKDYVTKGIEVSWYGDTKEYEEKSNCGLNAIQDILDLEFYGGKRMPEGFRRIINMLLKKGYTSGVNLFALPYDWRLSCLNAGTDLRIKQALEISKKMNNGKKMVIVSHSFGTLHAINFAYNFPEEANAGVESLILSGSPLTGVPISLIPLLLGEDSFNIKIPPFLDLFLDMKVQIDNVAGLEALYDFIPSDVWSKFKQAEWMKAFRNRMKGEKLLEQCIRTKKLKFKTCYDRLKSELTEIGFFKFDKMFDFYPKITDQCVPKNISFGKKSSALKEWDRKCRLKAYDYMTEPIVSIQKESMNIHNPEDTKNFVTKHWIDKRDRKDLYELNRQKVEKSKLNSLDNTKLNIVFLIKTINMKTIAGFKLPESPRVAVKKKNDFVLKTFAHQKHLKKYDTFYYYTGGDGRQSNSVAFLPILKWANDFTTNKDKDNGIKPIKIIEYCGTRNALNKRTADKLFSSKNEYLSIKCDCDKSESENCDHAGMTGDKSTVKFVDLISDNKRYRKEPSGLAGFFDSLRSKELNIKALKCSHNSVARRR